MCRGECFRERRFLQPCFPKAQEWGWASTLSILAKDPLGMEGQPCILSFIHTLSVFPVISPSLPFLSISFRAGPMECVRLQGCSLHKVIWPLGTEGSALHTQIHGRGGPKDGWAYGRASLFTSPQVLMSESDTGCPTSSFLPGTLPIYCTFCLRSHLKVSPANTGAPRGQAGGCFQRPFPLFV